MNFYEALNIPVYENDDEQTVIDKVYDMKYAKLYKSCSRNIFLIYLSFLQECVDMESFSFIKDKILSFKYYNSFINHDVESCLIESCFEVSKVNYVNLHIIAETLGIDINACDKIILDCLKDTIEITISFILSIDDDKYSDDYKQAMSINNQCMLRAALSLLGKNDYIMISCWLSELINSLSNDNNMIGVNIINTIINNMNQDKSRVRKISTRVRFD